MMRFGRVPRDPLYRLLLINLTAGVAVAVLLLGGLLLFNPGNLRGLIVSDRTPYTPLLLLLFGFVITFGSAAMGTAIMTIGSGRRGRPRSGGVRSEPIAVPAAPPCGTGRAQSRSRRSSTWKWCSTRWNTGARTKLVAIRMISPDSMA